MPRVAIKDYNTSFFHIMVQGIRREYIFENNEDKEKYLELIYKYLQKFDIKIIAYCIMSNHAHLLVYVERIDQLSEFMRSVNTTYALYYNKKYKKVGYVFRNRYKVEPIYSEKYLINCMNYIHDNPIKAKICSRMEEYKYSSYYEYKTKQGKIIKASIKKFKEINILYIEKIFEQTEIDYSFMDYEEENEFVDKEIVIQKFIKDKKISKNEIVKKEEWIKELFTNLSKKSGLTHQEIANEFGISRVKVTRLINNK